MSTTNNRSNYCSLWLFNLNSQLNYSIISFIALSYIEYDNNNAIELYYIPNEEQ